MKYVFVINKFTVNKLSYLCERIRTFCDLKKMEYIIEFNNSITSTEDILKKYLNTNYIIFAVGGDGMINRVLNSIVNTDNILSFIPYGTGNDFYKTVKIQFKNGINTCDLVKINNKYFINTACFGIDADIANDISKVSKLKILKKYKYIISLFKHFCSYKSKFFEVNVDGDVYKDKFVTLVITNGQYYGGGFHIGPNSKLDNDSIDFYLVKDLNKFKILNLILKMKKGNHENNKNLRKYSVAKLKIKSKSKIVANIDGESIQAKAFNIEVLKKKQLIYYNKELIDYILK